MIDFNMIPSPCYVMEEELLRRNLSLIKSVKERAGVNVILAFKAFAMWKAFPIVREYIPYSTASSKFEARLAFEEMGSRAHTYSPAYTEADFPEILRYSSHVTFNSLTQFERFYPMVQADGNRAVCASILNIRMSKRICIILALRAPGWEWLATFWMVCCPTVSRACIFIRFANRVRMIWKRRWEK